MRPVVSNGTTKIAKNFGIFNAHGRNQFRVLSLAIFGLSFLLLADVCIRSLTLKAVSLCTLTICSGSAARDFLNRLTLPSLRSIQFIQRMDNVIINSLISLITRSSCPLKVLQLDIHAFQGPEILQLLRTTPSLTVLDISFRDNTGLTDFIRNVMNGDHSRSSNFLPNLKIIRTSLCNGIRFSWEDILGGLESNLGGQDAPGLSRIYPFRSIKLHYRLRVNAMKLLTEDTLRRFADLIALGHSISVDYYGEDVIAKSLAFHFSLEKNV